MKKKRYAPILYWWLLTSLIILGSVATYFCGVFRMVYEADESYLSFLIYAVFIFESIRIGINTFRLRTLGLDADKLYRRNNEGWFFSRLLPLLGMLGTIIGFMIVLNAVFSGTEDVSDISILKETLPCILRGMGTAMYTTAAGIVGSILLRLQAFNVSQHLDKIVDERSKRRK
jgi:hypothetical protein